MTTLIALASILAVLVVTLAAQVMVTADKLADCEAALRRAKLRNDRLERQVDWHEYHALPTAPVFDILTARRARDQAVLNERDETFGWEA